MVSKIFLISRGWLEQRPEQNLDIKIYQEGWLSG